MDDYEMRITSESLYRESHEIYQSFSNFFVVYVVTLHSTVFDILRGARFPRLAYRSHGCINFDRGKEICKTSPELTLSP